MLELDCAEAENPFIPSNNSNASSDDAIFYAMGGRKGV